MARIVVIGGSGHVGTYLLPALLVARGHEVVNVAAVATASPVLGSTRHGRPSSKLP